MLISPMDGSLVWSNRYHQSGTLMPPGAVHPIIPGWPEGPDLRCAIAHRGNLEIPDSHLSMRPGMTVSPPDRGVRIAPGDEFRHDKAFAASPELHVIALGVGDLAAGRGDERVSSGDVPFAGRAEAGIDVGSPLRHPAELDRGAEHRPDRAGPRLNESFGPDVSMRAADRRDPWVAAFRQRAGMDRLDHGPVRP